MQEQYDCDDNDQFEHIGLGSRKKKMTKNEQIYGDFYQAYQQPQKKNTKLTYSHRSSTSAYNHFKAGSTIQNYAAQIQVHIPQPKPKKKVKTNSYFQNFQSSPFQKQQQQKEQGPVIGQFNLHSFLKQYQQKQQLQQIDEEMDEEQYEGPYCLNQKIKKILRLIKIGQEDDDDDWQDGQMPNLNDMTFEQYRKLVMRNGKQNNQEEIKKKKLTPEEKQKQKQFVLNYGKGYSMLQKMGFNLSKGLGKQQKGIQKPVQAVFKTSFTTKDSQLKNKKSQQPQQQSQTAQQQIPAQQHLFLFRSKNTKINNFLIDLKNKYQSLGSKIFFYQKEIQNYDRDFQINNSLKLQKMNEIQSYEEEIKKLSDILQYGKKAHQKLGSKEMREKDDNNSHKQEQITSKNILSVHPHPHLALQYKMDILFVKNQYLLLKSLQQAELYQNFPQIIGRINTFLNNFYLSKQKQTIKKYQSSGKHSFVDKNNKVIDLQEDEEIDLVDQGPTDVEIIASVSFDDKQKIIQMIQLIAQNTLMNKVDEMFSKYRHVGDIKNFKILQCLRVLKNLNKKSELVVRIVKDKIKPLLIKYYTQFQYDQKLGQQRLLPHLIIFPLFQIMDPAQLQLGKLFTQLSRKLWSLKSFTLYNIIKPLLQYCPSQQRQTFINFYLAPRMLYHLEEFDLSQPHICKQLLSGFKKYKQFFPEQILKDLLNCTIIPQIVMTYKKYQQQQMPKKDLSEWLKRWNKQINKILVGYFQETLFNDFHIQN